MRVKIILKDKWISLTTDRRSRGKGAASPKTAGTRIGMCVTCFTKGKCVETVGTEEPVEIWSDDGARIGKAFSVIARVSPVYCRLLGAKFSFEEGLEI